MTGPQDSGELYVKCYSGRTYAETPLSFTWRGVTHEVETIEKEWLEPGKKCFLVKTGGTKRYQLCYNESRERWSLTEVRR